MCRRTPVECLRHVQRDPPRLECACGKHLLFGQPACTTARRNARSKSAVRAGGAFRQAAVRLSRYTGTQFGVRVFCRKVEKFTFEALGQRLRAGYPRGDDQLRAFPAGQAERVISDRGGPASDYEWKLKRASRRRLITAGRSTSSRRRRDLAFRQKVVRQRAHSACVSIGMVWLASVDAQALWLCRAPRLGDKPARAG